MLNKATLIGNLGADPEVRNLPNGGTVTTLSVATSFSYKKRDTGEKITQTEWHRVVAFNKLAEIMADYLKKGSRVHIEGRLQTRKWQDSTGVDRYTTEIIAGEMNMLDRREGGGDQGQNQGQAQATNQRPAATQQGNNGNNRPNQGTARNQPPQPPIDDYNGFGDEYDDDIPF